MNKIILSTILGLSSIVSYGQSYSDFFTTYKDPTIQSQESSYVPKLEVLDPNEFIRKVTPQNIQVATGIYLKGNSIQLIKIQVGVLRKRIIVTSYWDGNQWNSVNSFASNLPDSAPKELRQVCMYQVYISSLGHVYF